MTGRATNTSAIPTGDPCGEILRAVHICHPGAESAGRLTFRPAKGGGVSWQQWKEEIFVPILRPALEEARRACLARDAALLARCEAELDRSLPEDLARASRRAGVQLAGQWPAPSGEKFWRRHAARIAAGESPGHLAVVLAVRASSFHLAPAMLAGAYVFLEARGGLPQADPALWLEMCGDCMAAASEGREEPRLRAA